MTTVGFAFTPESAEMSAPLAEHSVALVRSDGWDVPPRHFSYFTRPSRPHGRRPCVLRPKALPSVLTATLLSPDTSEVTMSAWSPSTARAECRFDTDPEFWRGMCEGQPKPHLQVGGFRALGAEVNWGRWLDALLVFADRAPAIMGVIYGPRNSTENRFEIEFLARYCAPEPDHARYAQWNRLVKYRLEIGDRYVRFPRWGTLYAHRHVEELGGVGKIVDVVRPAVVRELSGGVYFQLTESLAGLRSQEAVVKERAFEALVEPLLPPVVVEEVKHA